MECRSRLDWTERDELEAPLKVLWLGAGAAKSAGYPTGRELLTAITDAFAKKWDVATEEAWERFSKFRDSATGVERSILFSSNPEVVLTLPDLLAAALEDDNEESDTETSDFVSTYSAGLLSKDKLLDASVYLEKRFTSPAREPLERGRRARRDFLTVLNAFLAWNHHQDGQTANAARRDSLRRELGWLSTGDVVVTTNWDTTVERTLLEQLKWTPADGYGFPVHVVDGFLADSMQSTLLSPSGFPEPRRLES